MGMMKRWLEENGFFEKEKPEEAVVHDWFIDEKSEGETI